MESGKRYCQKEPLLLKTRMNGRQAGHPAVVNVNPSQGFHPHHPLGNRWREDQLWNSNRYQNQPPDHERLFWAQVDFRFFVISKVLRLEHKITEYGYTIAILHYTEFPAVHEEPYIEWNVGFQPAPVKISGKIIKNELWQ
jgi:hypothetical protein